MANEHGEDLYTPEVQKHIYEIKGRLPNDFPLITEEREIFIIIVVDMRYFEWRTVEDRLAIALELEKLRTAIEGTGIGCLIEKVAKSN